LSAESSLAEALAATDFRVRCRLIVPTRGLGDGPSTVWCRVSLPMLKDPRIGRPDAWTGSDPCSPGSPLRGRASERGTQTPCPPASARPDHHRSGSECLRAARRGCRSAWTPRRLPSGLRAPRLACELSLDERPSRSGRPQPLHRSPATARRSRRAAAPMSTTLEQRLERRLASPCLASLDNSRERHVMGHVVLISPLPFY